MWRSCSCDVTRVEQIEMTQSRSWNLLSMTDTAAESRHKMVTSTPIDEFILIIDDQARDSGVQCECRRSHSVSSAKSGKSISRRIDFDAVVERSDKSNDEDDKSEDFECVEIPRELDLVVSDLQRLVEIEEMLTKRLSTNCEEYHRQNKKYVTRCRHKLHVDEIQNQLDRYAKKIIKTELKLQQIKDEIHQKCEMLYSMHQMFNSSDSEIII